MIRLWILLFLVSCGSNGGGSSSSTAASSASHANINPEFQPYVNSFVKHMRSSGHSLKQLDNLQMHFSQNLDSTVLGYCEQETFYENKVEVKRVSTIYINETSWFKPSFNLKDKEQLTFHELAHCLLNRNHSETKIDALIANLNITVPKSIMTPRHYDARPYYQKDGNSNSYNYGSYIQELFNYPLPLQGLVFDGSEYESALPSEPVVEFMTYEEPLEDGGKTLDERDEDNASHHH